MLALDGLGNVEHYNGDYTEYHDWKAVRSEPRLVGADLSVVAETRPSGRVQSGKQSSRRSASASADGSKRADSETRPRGPQPGSPAGVGRSGRARSGTRSSHGSPSASADGSRRLKVVKKPRDSEIIENEITQLEKRIAELSSEMTKPEVARDISKLVKANDEYEQAQAGLAELLDEWERAETARSAQKRR